MRRRPYAGGRARPRERRTSESKISSTCFLVASTGANSMNLAMKWNISPGSGIEANDRCKGARGVDGSQS